MLVLVLDFFCVNQTEASWKGGIWKKGRINRGGRWGRGWEDCKIFSSWKLTFNNTLFSPSVYTFYLFTWHSASVFLLLPETQRHCWSYRDWQSKPGETKEY
jgi:hypothetical protein